MRRFTLTPKFIFASVCLLLWLSTTQSAEADGFEAPTWRALGRELGIGFGPGYHSVPCVKSAARHYQRSVQGYVHPRHRCTPVYKFNTPRPHCHLGRACERAPYYLGNRMPPLDMPRPVPTVGPRRADTSAPSFAEPDANSEEATDGSSASEAANSANSSRYAPYSIERLPNVDEEFSIDENTSEPYSPLDDMESLDEDGSSLDDINNDDGSADEARLYSNPLSDHPLWDENGPAQPRLYDKMETSQNNSGSPW